MWLTHHFASKQTKETAVQQDNGAPGKKKRKKRKKAAKVVGEDENAESEGPTGYREPPKFEVIKILNSIQINAKCQIFRLWMENHFYCLLSCQDEEEFPGLTLASTVNDRLMTSSNAAKLCNEVHTYKCFSSNTCSHNSFNPISLVKCILHW